MDQTVEIGGEIETVTITGITSYTRSWGINFLDIPQNAINGQVVISGAIKTWASAGSYTENLKINGETVAFKLTVVKPASSSSVVVSSSSSVPASSSSTISESSSSFVPGSSSSIIPGIVESSSSIVPMLSSSSITQAIAAIASDLFKMSFARNELTLSMVKSSRVTVQVFDMMGNMVKSQSVAVSGSAVLSMDGLRQGNYMIRVVDGSAIRTARIAIK